MPQPRGRDQDQRVHHEAGDQRVWRLALSEAAEDATWRQGAGSEASGPGEQADQPEEQGARAYSSLEAGPVRPRGSGQGPAQSRPCDHCACASRHQGEEWAEDGDRDLHRLHHQHHPEPQGDQQGENLSH